MHVPGARFINDYALTLADPPSFAVHGLRRWSRYGDARVDLIPVGRGCSNGRCSFSVVYQEVEECLYAAEFQDDELEFSEPHWLRREGRGSIGCAKAKKEEF